KWTWGWIWVAPRGLRVGGRPGAPAGLVGDSTDAGTAAPSSSIPAWYTIPPDEPARATSASSGLRTPGNGTTRALPPPPSSGAFAVGPITASERRSRGARGRTSRAVL